MTSDTFSGVAPVAPQLIYEQLHVSMFFDQTLFVFSSFYDASNPKRRALKCCESVFNFQPMNSDLKPFRVFLDDVNIKTTFPQVAVFLRIVSH